MAATVSIKEVNGASPGTATTITNLRHCTSDTYNPGTSYPIPRPSSGIKRGYWKTIYLNADTSPSGTIDNIKFYCDGSIDWTGCTLYIGTTDTYTQATGTEGDSGDDSTVATTDITTYTSSSPLSVNGSISNPDTGKISDYVILQLDVTSSASAGLLSQETLTFQYDET